MDTKRRSYDIFDIEDRVHALELGGGDTPTPGGSWDYSTDEVDTKQKWTDGKTIYCKVITGTFAFPSNLNPVNIGSFSDLSTVIDVTAVSTQGESSVASCTNAIMCYVDSGTLKAVSFGQFNASAIILRYTKTEATKSTKRSKK